MRYLALCLTLAACAGDPAQTLADAAPDTDAADATDARDAALVEAAVDAAPDASPPDAPADVAVADAPADVPAVDIGADAAPADRPDAADVATDAPDPLEAPAAALSIAMSEAGETSALTPVRCTATQERTGLVIDFGGGASVAGTLRQGGASVFGVGSNTSIAPTIVWRTPYDTPRGQRVNVRVSAMWSRLVVVTVLGCPIT